MSTSVTFLTPFLQEQSHSKIRYKLYFLYLSCRYSAFTSGYRSAFSVPFQWKGLKVNTMWRLLQNCMGNWILLFSLENLRLRKSCLLQESKQNLLWTESYPVFAQHQTEHKGLPQEPMGTRAGCREGALKH